MPLPRQSPRSGGPRRPAAPLADDPALRALPSDANPPRKDAGLTPAATAEPENTPVNEPAEQEIPAATAVLTAPMSAPLASGETGAATPPDLDEAAASRTSDDAGSAADAAGARDGAGRGRRGFGRGGPPLARIDGELHARVYGRQHEVVPVANSDGPPFITDREATTLRTRDYFPRLPGEEWTAHGPYVVTLDICVDADGSVMDATLRSSASASLDAIVLSAARTWRYRPRVVNGRAAAFCHRVVIRYDRW